MKPEIRKAGVHKRMLKKCHTKNQKVEDSHQEDRKKVRTDRKKKGPPRTSVFKQIG